MSQEELVVKVQEYQRVFNYVDEIDLVAPISLIKSGKWYFAKEELKCMDSYTSYWDTPIKLIVETCYLNEEEIKKVCDLCNNLKGITCIKTSTGFGTRGATVEDIQMIKKYWDGDIKASGGIKTKEQAMDLINAGATIIGTSTAF